MKQQIIIVLLFLPLYLFAQQDFEHPRGIISKDEVAIIQQRIEKEPYRRWFDKIKSTAIESEKNLDPADPYQTIWLAQKQAQLYILTNDKSWAVKCWKTLQYVIHDEVYFNDPVSRGLTRATQLMGVAICYDLCFNAWDDSQRKLVNKKLFQTMLNTNSNMGFTANYNMESNWNGVRWGSALMAALVYDDFDKQYSKNPALPFIWDIQKRIKDHINRNVFPGGWSAESLSYHGYNWSFLAPALIANQNNSSSPFFELENYAPHAINSLWGWSIASSSISHPGGRGTQPDFSDDDPQSSYSLIAPAFRLYPREQLPALKWMHDYLLDVKKISDERGQLFYSICWYPEELTAQNPEELGWNTFVDESYGTSVWRNRFKNEDDIIVAFSAPIKRVPGHKAPDNLSFRIIGLGNIWVIGAGRTGQIAGQTNLFLARPKEKEKPPSKIKESSDFKYGKKGNEYFTSAKGSCMGVENHKRTISVNFNGENTTVIKVNDTSANGKIWRLNTPEFNDVKFLKNGYILTAPNGSKMKITAPLEQIRGEITVSKVPYGGSTGRHNHGIGFGDQFWPYNKAIDIPCEGGIDVTIELSK